MIDLENEILSILDDSSDEKTQTEEKINEISKNNSFPSSPKEDIESSSSSQQNLTQQTPQEQVEVQIQATSVTAATPKPVVNEKVIDSLDELFTNPHEKPLQEENKIESNELVNIEVEKKHKVTIVEPPIQTENESQKKADDNRAKSLAERLRQKAKIAKPKKQLSFSYDLSEESSDSTGLKIVVSQKQKRQLHREQLLEAHARVIKEDINEAPNQEIQEEEYDVEEEEEEEEKNEKLQDNEIAKTVIEELKKEDDEEDKENLSEEELEHRLYERIVEMRLTEDLEEIKKIIRIITGQWRSGKLRFGDIAEGLEKAFEGNEKEMKELETKRMMRKQRKQKRNEEKTRRLTQENITQLIEKAMWIKAGQDENASASDIIRGEMAKLSDNDPRKVIMERLEMEAFVQEERSKNALKERRISKNHMQKVERINSSGSKENSFSKISFKSSQISRQHLFSFNLSKEKAITKENISSPKKTERKPKKVDKKFAELFSKVNK